MHETPSTSVTENLAVQSDEQPGERRTKIILWVVAILLLIGGLAGFFFVGNHEEGPTTQIELSTNPFK